MPYLAVDKIGIEVIFQDKPSRVANTWCVDGFGIEDRVYLSDGTIKKLIGKDLTWSDEPVEI